MFERDPLSLERCAIARKVSQPTNRCRRWTGTSGGSAQCPPERPLRARSTQLATAWTPCVWGSDGRPAPRRAFFIAGRRASASATSRSVSGAPRRPGSAGGGVARSARAGRGRHPRPPADVLRPRGVRLRPDDRLEPRLQERAARRRSRFGRFVDYRDFDARRRLQARLGAEPPPSPGRPGPRLPRHRRGAVRARVAAAARVLARRLPVRPRHELAQHAGAGHPPDQLGLRARPDPRVGPSRRASAIAAADIASPARVGDRRVATRGGSSANNHLIGEAAGVFVATAYFQGLDPAGRLHEREPARSSPREILRQSHPDGGTREQGIGYQIFVLQFYLVVDAVARAIGRPLPAAFEARLERMLDFVRRPGRGWAPCRRSATPTTACVLDLGARARPGARWLAVGAVRFERPDFARLAEVPSRDGALAAGPRGDRAPRGACAASCAAPTARVDGLDRVRLLPAAGGRGRRPGSASLFDCGELGFGSIAAHGHADALSFALRAFGEDVLVDPGTYDYFTHPEWRRYFRSTRAHNTVEIDGLDQSTMDGPFLWGQRATARCLGWEPTPRGRPRQRRARRLRRLAGPGDAPADARARPGSRRADGDRRDRRRGRARGGAVLPRGGDGDRGRRCGPREFETRVRARGRPG